MKKYDLFEIVGFTVNEGSISSELYLDFPVYPVETIEQYADPENVKIFIAVSWYHHLMKTRMEKFEYLRGKGYHFANLISPYSIVQTNQIGEGNWILEQVYIGYNAKIGSNNVFICNSSLGHYSQTGDHNFFGAKANLLGHVTIGNRCFIGSSALIFNKTTIGDKCIIGAGSVIKKNLGDCTVSIVPQSKTVQVDDETVETMINIK